MVYIVSNTHSGPLSCIQIDDFPNIGVKENIYKGDDFYKGVGIFLAQISLVIRYPSKLH